MIAPGRYSARPIAVGLVDPKGNGAIQMMIELEIPATGQTILWFGSLNKNPPPRSDRSALAITVEALRALGWRGDDLHAVDFPPDAEATITVRHETYQGRTRAKVASIAAPALERFAVAQDQAQQVGESLRAAVRELGPTRNAARHAADDYDDPRGPEDFGDA